MNKFLIFCFMFLILQAKPVEAQKPNRHAEILPQVWTFVDVISQNIVRSKNIEKESRKRKNSFFLKIQEKSYVQILRDQRARIRELRTEIFETKYFIQSNKQPTSEELESELCELLNKPADLELNVIDENNLIQIMDSEPDPRVLEQPSTVMNFNKPTGWVLPPKSEQPVSSPQTPVVSECSQQSSISSCDVLNMPPEFFCPIIHRIMRFPVVASDGYTYEEKAIKRWFFVSNGSQIRSPMTNAPLQNLELIPNLNLKKLMMDMEEQTRLHSSAQTSPMVQVPSRLGPTMLFSNKATQVSPVVSSASASPQVRTPGQQARSSVALQTSFSPKPVLGRTFRTKAIADVEPSNKLSKWSVSDLEWELDRRDSKPMNFTQARNYCAQKGGEWRLPTIWELFSLLLQDSLEEDFGAGFYWSSTVAMDTECPEILFIHFPDGLVSSAEPDSDSQVRCVRSPVNS